MDKSTAHSVCVDLNESANTLCKVIGEVLIDDDLPWRVKSHYIRLGGALNTLLHDGKHAIEQLELAAGLRQPQPQPDRVTEFASTITQRQQP